MPNPVGFRVLDPPLFNANGKVSYDFIWAFVLSFKMGLRVISFCTLTGLTWFSEEFVNLFISNLSCCIKISYWSFESFNCCFSIFICCIYASDSVSSLLFAHNYSINSKLLYCKALYFLVSWLAVSCTCYNYVYDSFNSFFIIWICLYDWFNSLVNRERSFVSNEVNF